MPKRFFLMLFAMFASLSTLIICVKKNRLRIKNYFDYQSKKKNSMYLLFK